MKSRFHIPLAVLVFLAATCKSRKYTKASGSGKRKIVVFKNWNKEQVIQKSVAYLQGKGVRPVHALPSIKAISCELYGNCNTREILRDPNVLRVDDDIEIKIKPLPHIRTILQRPMTDRTIIPWGVERVQAPPVWNYFNGAGIKAAVIDTGVDLTHPMLVPNLRRGINILDPSQLPNDDNGHGTHVAGTLGACGGKGKLIGVAPDIEIYPVKAFDKHGKALLSDIGKAVEWCMENNIRLLNMSYGTSNTNASLEEIYIKAYERGAIMVAAAGNSGPDGEIGYPGKYPFTITVGATTMDNEVASFSSRGNSVDICAPGVEILSCWLNGGTKRLKGTSMATPHVSGTIALMLSANPYLQFAQIKQIIQSTATKLPGVERVMQGMGLVNTERALQMLY